jgi:chorismate-pyruvate lyase
LGFCGRLRRTARARGDPPLGLLKNGRTQQQPTRAARSLAELGVLPDPADVRLERVGEPIGALLETRRIVEENEVEPL